MSPLQVPCLLLLFWPCACAPVLVDVYVQYMFCLFRFFLFAAVLTVERKSVYHDHACLAIGCKQEKPHVDTQYATAYACLHDCLHRICATIISFAAVQAS